MSWLILMDQKYIAWRHDHCILIHKQMTLMNKLIYSKWVKNLQLDNCISIHDQKTLMSRFILMSQKHTAWPVYPDSWRKKTLRSCFYS